MEKHVLLNSKQNICFYYFLIELPNVFKVCEYTLAELNY